MVSYTNLMKSRGNVHGIQLIFKIPESDVEISPTQIFQIQPSLIILRTLPELLIESPLFLARIV